MSPEPTKPNSPSRHSDGLPPVVDTAHPTHPKALAVP